MSLFKKATTCLPLQELCFIIRCFTGYGDVEYHTASITIDAISTTQSTIHGTMYSGSQEITKSYTILVTVSLDENVVVPMNAPNTPVPTPKFELNNLTK